MGICKDCDACKEGVCTIRALASSLLPHKSIIPIVKPKDTCKGFRSGDYNPAFAQALVNYEQKEGKS